jgi:hypothetical protein
MIKPSAPVLDIFSDPAKSTRFKTPFFSELSAYLCLISTMKIEWALEEC